MYLECCYVTFRLRHKILTNDNVCFSCVLDVILGICVFAVIDSPMGEFVVLYSRE